MTLGEFACLLDADPKWIQNLAAAVGGPLPYTVAAARRVAISRALAQHLGVPLAEAYAMAGQVLKRYDGSSRPVAITDHPDVTASIDVYRVLAAVNVGLSRVRTMYAPRQRGRPPRRRRDPVRRAKEYGLDLTLLAANLRRTPAERLRQLEGMAAFVREVRRVRPLTARARPAR